MEGWIKLHRKLLDNPIVCKDSDYLSVWIYLLLNATHEKYDTIFKNERVTLKAGQLITGRKVIANKFGIDENKVQRILKTLEKQHQIEQQTSNQNRLVSIVNWDEYQENRQQNEQQVNNERTTDEQRVNTNKNDKNEKNDKNDEEDDIIKCYEENIGMLTPASAEKIFSYLDELNSDMIIQAIKKASINNKKSTSYIQGILNSWIRKGYKTLIDIEQENNTEKKEEKTIEQDVKEKIERFNKYLKENGIVYEEEVKEKPKIFNKTLNEEEIKIL